MATKNDRDDLYRKISERPALLELFAKFRDQAARPPFPLADAAAAAIIAAFELGRRVGEERAADRVSGVLRSLEFEGRA